ncbi:MAG: DUF4825 domain-containing protein, partial [Oscillospiraceae bacterium]|nr:DUF4825 domain-containing protein [Oscillospiraceae bacterium]
TEEELRYVMLHEQTHIKRCDYLVKLLAFALLCLHWFNPLVWAAFMLLCADMEMSCDERVLRELGMGVKADYSQTLLSLSMNRRIFSASPLAFGESDIKERIKNVLNFKKSSRIIMAAAVALVAVLTVGFAVNGESRLFPMTMDDNLRALSLLRTPYVGNNSAVGKIIDLLPPLGDELTQRFFSIGDDYGAGPYTLTLYYEQDGAERERNITAQPTNAALLFALIDNLEEVSFAFRNTPSDGKLDKAAYTSGVTINKEQTGDFIGNFGLTWEDFQSDFETAALAVFIQPAQAETPSEAAAPLYDPNFEEDSIQEFVSAFGAQISEVRLMVPQEEAASQIRGYYSDFLTPELLEMWATNPDTALGRAVSSPWPDRIDVTKLSKFDINNWAVYGNIIWITSVEAVNGGAAAIQPITLKLVTDNGNGWRINEVSVGEYESAAASRDYVQAPLTGDITDFNMTEDKASVHKKTRLRRILDL